MAATADKLPDRFNTERGGATTATDRIPDRILLEIVTPQGNAVSVEVDEVTATGAMGEFGILPGHLPMLTALNAGPLGFRRKGEQHQVMLGAGFAEAGPDHLVVLVDRFERGEIYGLRSLLDWQPSFELEALKSALGRAEGRLRELEAQDQEKSEEAVTLTQLINNARARLEKR